MFVFAGADDDDDDAIARVVCGLGPVARDRAEEVDKPPGLLGSVVVVGRAIFHKQEPAIIDAVLLIVSGVRGGRGALVR